MISFKPPIVLALLCCFTAICLSQPAQAVDVRRGIPADAHLAVYGKYNPERDYQGDYYEEVLQTIEDERIIPRFVEIVTSRMPPEKLAEVKKIFSEISDAAAPVSWDTLETCEEVAFGQRMEAPFNHSLVLLRCSSSGAEQMEAAGKNLFGLVEKYSEGNVPVVTENQGAATVYSLGNIPKESPFVPVVARLDDVFLFSTSPEMLTDSLELLQSDSGKSKFDDPRLAEVLKQLPEAEDSVTFFDGQELFTNLRGIGGFIREQGQRGNPEKQVEIERIASLVELLIDELSVPDYEVSIEYTEGNRNRSATLGRYVEGAEDTLLGTLLIGGEPFADWQSWIPEDAVSYSLTSGKSLSPFYQRLTALLREHIPELNEPLDKFEVMQEQIGVHLDRDILQSFEGGCVSITLPATSATGESTHHSVMAVKCKSPERVKELLHMVVDRLNEFPAVQPQQIRWEESETLSGFEQLHAAFFAMFGVEPVVGFEDGWMFLGSHAEAVARVLDVRAGKSPSIASSEQFQRFGVEIEGPVSSLSYTNLADSIRHGAQTIRQVGAIAPMFIGMAGAQADPEELKPVMEVIALLPSVANVVEKFDFLEESLSVVQPGDEPRTYVKQGVVLIREPGE